MIQRHSRIRKRHLALLLVAAGSVAAYAYRNQINQQLGCWAYYDQCTAKRISGLSITECFSRNDDVAYLTTEGVCLVRDDQ